ncbi:MAG: acetylxylan esterase [Verrucomicrobia bacterium]|nr:acetylxylan esterase [Verrucomicrobiota bacterium]
MVINYDESKIPQYTLPDPLITENGVKIQSASAWHQVRRPELLSLFSREMFGAVPGLLAKAQFHVTSDQKDALGGLARRKEVTIRLSGEDEKQSVEVKVLLYLPAKANNPSPVFLGYNFYGNHSIHTDSGITLSTSWMRDNEDKGVKENQATEDSRGTSSNRWPIEMILKRGYGVVTAYYGDIDPDFHDGWQNGIHPMFYRESQNAPEPHQWGSVAAWAWGLSRIMDYLETDAQVASNKVSVMGHSRLGKTSLWAGATDQRFAVVISNNSGCGGAALSRRSFGETVRRINSSFPHWFCGNFAFYNDRESLLPFDQHQLIALIAPRPVYIASAQEDRWADPKGEFLSGVHADPVYRLLGKNGISEREMPEVNQPIGNTIGYHIRTGKHNVTVFDWEQYLRFADRHLN